MMGSNSLVHTNLQLSSFGVIPKKSQPGKWQIIIDLSSPAGNSSNDDIDSSLRLSPTKRLVRRQNSPSRLVREPKTGPEERLQISPSTPRLLAMQWKDTKYLDDALPLGLRSAPLHRRCPKLETAE